MLNAPLPINETARLASLHKMQILATPAEEAFDRITRVVQHVFQVPTALITLVDEHRQWFKSRIGMAMQDTPRDISFCAHVVYSESTLVIEDASKDERFRNNPLVYAHPHTRFYAGQPLRNHEGFVVGSLCVIDTKPRQVSEKELSMLSDLGHWAESVFMLRGLSRVTETLLSELDYAKRESLIDPMLRVWNRGAIMDVLMRENDHAWRNGDMLALLMVDIDHFKKINDQHGHPIGDAALIQVVNIIRQQLRSYDSLGRYGGEEFMVVLLQSNHDGVARLAERLRNAVEKTPIHIDGHALQFTISIGITVVDGKGIKRNIEEIVTAADQALLRAKASGRNRIEYAQA